MRDIQSAFRLVFKIGCVGGLIGAVFGSPWTVLAGAYVPVFIYSLRYSASSREGEPDLVGEVGAAISASMIAGTTGVIAGGILLAIIHS